MIRLLIADDHAIVREGLKKIFAMTSDIDLVAEAVDGHGVIQYVQSTEHFDLLLLDLTMPGVTGTDLISRIKMHRPNLPILIFSMHHESKLISRAIRAGASGYIAKDSAPGSIVEAIRRVVTGIRYIDPALNEQLTGDFQMPKQTATHDLLSKREYEVFRMLVAGLRINDIADQLSISNKTVSTHKLHLMEKMKMTNMAELVRYALHNGLFQ